MTTLHHRLVVDGQQLLADTLGNRVKAGAGTAGKNYSFHVNIMYCCKLSERPAGNPYYMELPAGNAFTCIFGVAQAVWMPDCPCRGDGCA